MFLLVAWHCGAGGLFFKSKNVFSLFFFFFINLFSQISVCEIFFLFTNCTIGFFSPHLNYCNRYKNKNKNNDRLIGLVGRVFGNGPEDLGTIPSRVIPKTLKMVLNTSLLNLFTNPSARAGYNTRSIFKRSLTGLNSEFSFSETCCLT